MDANPQEALHLTIEDKKGNTIEFISHQDLHYWLYFNGVMLDVNLPRHVAEGIVREFKGNGKQAYDKLISNLWFGKSKYNRKKVDKFFVALAPEFYI